MKFTTSWDDGALQDIRLARLLEKYNIPGTFYIPVQCELQPKDILEIDRHFEVGSHTITHAVLTKISTEAVENECKTSKRLLEELLKHEVTSFCYPKGYYNEDVRKIVEAAGYARARTVKMGSTDLPKKPLEEETTVHVYPAHREIYDAWAPYAYTKFMEAINKKEEGYFHIWGHSWEIDKYRLWEELEGFFSDVNRYLKAFNPKRVYSKNNIII